MSTFGIDYAWDGPSVEAMKHAEVRFACRYLSYDRGKNLTRAEADRLSAAGIALVVVWETTANRALSGLGGGVADAREAAAQARECGMPADRPIYFAVDWDASSGQQPAINAYLDGAASVLGRHRVGLYAGYWVLRRAFDAGKVTWGWQTYAWSGGHWDPRAHIQQYKNGVNLGGSDVDYDRAMTSDYGQWRVGVSPEEDEVKAEDIDAIATAVVRKSFNARGRRVGQALQAVDDGMAAVLPLVKELAERGGVDVDEAALAAELLKVLTPEAIAAAVSDDVARDLADELARRLAG